MAKEPEEIPEETKAEVPVDQQWDAPWPDPALDPPGQPVAPAPWEAELDAFWQNVLFNVSSKVETPIHNFLHAETEALRARLKSLF